MSEWKVPSRASEKNKWSQEDRVQKLHNYKAYFRKITKSQLNTEKEM